ncbi:DUF4169 family protein [Tropicimonas sp.]|uniref:DUF4169 family protein n=1 Tax=Tropicimonas sp. TaxID=2067044 RepID=UPI003A88AF61
MAEPVNLNRFRKSRARRQAREAADRNAAFHGLTRAQKAAARAEAERATRAFEAGRRAPDDKKP